MQITRVTLPEPTIGQIADARSYMERRIAVAEKYKRSADHNLAHGTEWIGRFRAEMWYDKAQDVLRPLSSSIGSCYPKQLKDLKEYIDRTCSEIDTILARDLGRHDPLASIYGK